MSVTLHGTDSPLVHAFHTRVQKSLVYIERTCLDSGTTVAGTGTVFGYQGNKTDGWLPIVVSAGHVLRSATQAESRFRIQQFDWSDPAHPTARVLEFETGGKGGRAPCAVAYIGPHSEILDIGFIRGPQHCSDGSTFLALDVD